MRRRDLLTGLGAAAALSLAPPAHARRRSNPGFVRVDTRANRVVRTDVDGRELWSIAELGSGDRQVHHPMAAMVDALGQTWVADTGNDRVLVLSADGEPSLIVPDLRAPAGIVAFAEDVYVSEAPLHRLSRLSREGDLLGATTSVGGRLVVSVDRAVTRDVPGVLNYPTALFRCGDRVLISDVGHRRIVAWSPTSGATDFVPAPRAIRRFGAAEGQVLGVDASGEALSTPFFTF